jgi:broad specificity phosphatase PhoE
MTGTISNRIFIVRHGQTALNKARVLQGRSDQPLNDTGIQQARQAGKFLRDKGIVFDRVYSSPLIRAVQTAEEIAPGIPVTMDDRLIEMDYGPYEGMDLKNPSPEVMLFFHDFVHHPAPEGMEQLSAVVERTGSFMESIKDTGGNILISTHAIAMKGILEYLTPDSGGSYWSKYIGNCAVYTTECEDGTFTVPAEMKTE